MAITWGVEFVKKSNPDNKTLEERLEDQNNVKDLKNKVKDINTITDLNENEAAINLAAEADFDKFVSINKEKIRGFFDAWTYNVQGMEFMSTEFRKYLDTSGSNLNTYLLQLNDIDTSDIIKTTIFELEYLSDSIQLYFLKKEVESVNGSTSTQDKATTISSASSLVDKPRRKSDQDPSAAIAAVNEKGGNMRNAYTAEYYADIGNEEEEEDLSLDEEKKALKRLLKGKSEALDIVDGDYKRSWADKKMTGMLLRALLRIWGRKLGSQEINESDIAQALQGVIQEYNNGTRFDMDKWWKKRARAYGDKDKYKLGAMYQISVEDQQGFPYLQRVMGLFVQEFLKEESKSITKVYNEHNDMPTNINLITRKGKAIREVAKADDHQRQEIRKLLRLAGEVEINDLVSYSSLSTWDDADTNNNNAYTSIFNSAPKVEKPWRSLTPKEEKFVKLLDENAWDPIFTSVLEWLLAGMTIQELANAGKFEIPPNTAEKEQEQWFVMRFADLNFDGKVDFWDKGMVKGLQFQSIYREVATRMQYENQKLTNQLEMPLKTPLINILNFGLHIAEGMGNESFAKKIKELLAKGDKLTFSEINRFFNDKKNIPVLKFLQNAVMTSPLPVADILTHGKDAYQSFYNNSLEFKDSDEKINDKVMSQLKAQGIDLNKDVDPIIREGIFQAVTSFVTTESAGLGIGTSMDLDAILSGLSINVWVAATDDGKWVVWLHLARNKSMAVSETTSLYGWVSSWGNFAEGLVPLWTLSVGAGAEQWINQKRVENNLKPTSVKRISVWANITLINFTIPSRGVNLGYSVESGIQKQFDSIKSESSAIVKKALGSITDIKDQQWSLSAIQKVLSNEFEATNTETLRKAAWNMYRWLLAFDLEQADLKNSNKLDQVATMLGEYYALAWKNTAITWLQGRNFANASVGVQFLAGFFPVPTMALQWSKYKNLYYDATPESKLEVKKAEATGDGNELLSTTIGEREIWLINQSIENNFRNQKSKLNDTDNQAPDILLDTNSKTIKIPVDLWQKGIVNICLDPCLKWHIQQKNIEGRPYIIVPSEIPMRWLSDNNGYGAAYVLNLGDDKSDGGTDGQKNLTLRTGVAISNDWLWDPTKPVFEKITKVADINDLINTLNKNYKDFPLLSAARSPEIGKEKQTVFTLKAQTNGAPAYSVDPQTTDVVFNGNNALTLVPSTGELIVNYDPNKGYVFSYQSSPKDKLKISYKINNRPAGEVDEDNRDDTETIDFKKVKLFDFAPDSPLSKAETLITSLISQLKDAEKRNIKTFEEFLLHLWKIDEGNAIDATELNNAKTELTTILWANHDIITFITTNATDYKVIAYLMDRLKQVFAMEGWYENVTIDQLWTRRSDWYKSKCSSPSRNNLPDSIVRETLLPDAKKQKFNIATAQKTTNLIWYTAFYRDKKNPAYSLTAPGETTVCKDCISEPLSSDQLEEGKAWFLSNLDAQSYEKDLLLDAIQGHIPEEYKDQVTSDNIMEFLKTWELIVSIDNWTKKYKIKLNATYHFYLLGECANESLGMKINSIDIQEYAAPDDSWEVVPGYDNDNMGFSINSPQTRSEAFRGKKAKRWIAIGVGAAREKVTPPPPPNSTAVDISRPGSTVAE